MSDELNMMLPMSSGTVPTTPPTPGTSEPVSPPAPRTIARGIGIGLLGRLGGRAFHFLGMILLARRLGAETFGLIAIGWAVLRIGWIILPLGADRAVIAFGTPAWPRERGSLRPFLLKVITAVMGSGTAAAIGLHVLAPGIAHRFGMPALADVFRLIAPALPFAAGLYVAAAATQISLRVGYTVTGQELLQPLLFTLGLGWMALTGSLTLASTLRWLDGTFVLAFGVTLGFVLWLYRGPIGSPRPVPWPQLTRYAARVSAARWLFIPMMLSDRILAGFFGTSTDAGLYNAAAQIAVVFAVVMSAAFFILAPAFSRLHNGDARADHTAVYHQSRRWILDLTLPLGVILMVMPATVLSVLFGPRFAGAAGILRVLVAAQAVNILTGPAGTLLTMTRMEQRWLTAVAIGGGLYLVGLPVFGTTLGAFGVAVIYGIAMSTVYLTARRMVRRDLGVGPDRTLWRTLAVRVTVTAAVVTGIQTWIGVHTLSGLLALTALCYLIHGLFLVRNNLSIVERPASSVESAYFSREPRVQSREPSFRRRIDD